MKLRPASVRVRLTLWYASALTVIILGFALGVYLFLEASLLRQIDNHLRRDLATVERVLRQGPVEIEVLRRHGNVVLFRVAGEGGEIVTTGRWDRAGLPADAVSGRKPFWVTAGDGGAYRLLAAGSAPAGRSQAITVAHDGLTYRESMSSLALVLLVAVPAALLVAVAGGYLLAGRVLAPLGRMAATARAITAERLSERLPVNNPDDEFGLLATAFNETFLRLEESFARLRRFTADASHELRTPLTALRSVGEVGLQGNPDPAACREIIGSMLEETDRLTHVVDSLLLLGRADAGSVPIARERTDLVAVAAEVGECLQVLAEEKGQILSLKASQPVFAVVDRATLRQALINLVDNAIKYTPAAGRVTVAVRVAPEGEATIAVSDDGPGIPAAHRERIFERFYRADQGRARAVGGAGLGLSIARWAVGVNKGRIELEDREGGGSTFRIRLPLAT